MYVLLQTALFPVKNPELMGCETCDPIDFAGRFTLPLWYQVAPMRFLADLRLIRTRENHRNDFANPTKEGEGCVIGSESRH